MDLYRAISEMRRLSKENIPFSFVFMSYNSSNKSSEGVVYVRRARLLKRERIEHHKHAEIVEAYIKRLNDLEQLALSYPGVLKTYAIQAGRELRVIVGADKIDDSEIETLSAEIAKRIQDEMTYPGQVKITVIRETRAVSFAK